MQMGVEKQHVELSAANNWKHEFTNLPKYNDNGTLIKYTVKEDKIAGYNTEITGDANSGYKIKNVNVEKLKSCKKRHGRTKDKQGNSKALC